MKKNYLTELRDTYLLDSVSSKITMTCLFFALFVNGLIRDGSLLVALFDANFFCVIFWLFAYFLNKKYPKYTTTK